jgi:hypothetical protein
MKVKECVFLLVSCTLFVACENRKTENALPNTNQIQINQNSNGITAANKANNSVNRDLNSIANVQTNANDNADFAGTAGIIDKKNEIKAAALLQAVRSAQHGNYDRVVFEFEGAELPSYHIEYIDRPVRACGSGDVVPLPGDGWLEIRFTPANAHTEEGKPTVEKREYSPNHKIIKEMKSTCDFEAEVTWVLGVSSPNHYRVLELKNPTRLAVDIKHK